ncbi:MAG: glycosyltransferase family 4 protein [Lachnospiraceae bacterium]|nr:glycosyltransferase family 4 protein [Lachnospiraceae bacterium]
MILVIGDYYSGTGPALVTKYYIEYLPKGTDYIRSQGKAARFFELLRKIPKASVLFISGHSRQNILAMKLGKLLNIRSAYLMHGAVEYENNINRVPDLRMAGDERLMMEEADLILAVSRQFEEWLKMQYPEYEEKISHVTNGIDWGVMMENASGDARDPEGVITVGGGLPRKCVINVCKAVERLNASGHDITLTVAGKRGADSEAIDAYPFVRDIGVVSHEELLREYKKNKIFIQNSVFETFGLAPLEALLSYADVLISGKCGALSVIKKTEDTDIINDPQDTDEIVTKLEALLKGENHTRLLVELDRENTSWKKRASELETKLEELRNSPPREKSGRAGR